jgi:hypothetical protein
MATKKKPTTKKYYTLSEFKAWLEGVEELQPANWSPDTTQWKLIRDRLFSIVEEPPQQHVVEHQNHAQYYPEAPVPTRMPQPEYVPPANAWVPPPSAVAPMVEATPAAQALLSGKKLPSSMVPDASGKLKTPDVDTSDGNYGSSFE